MEKHLKGQSAYIFLFRNVLKISGICVGCWTGRMTDSEGEQVVTCQVTEECMRLRQEFL
jgi:hypothetical protein